MGRRLLAVPLARRTPLYQLATLLTRLTLLLNSLGDAVCRPAYLERLCTRLLQPQVPCLPPIVPRAASPAGSPAGRAQKL